MSDAAARPRRDYRPVTREYYEKQRASFTGMVVRAAHGDAAPLREFFEHGPRQLSEDDCDALAWLIDEKLVRRRGGRPPSAVYYAYCLWQVGLRAWRERRGFKRAPRKGTNKAPDILLEQAIELAQRNFPAARITTAAVKAFKPKLSWAEMEKSVWPEDRWQLRQLAWK